MADQTPKEVLPAPEVFCLEKPLYLSFPYSEPTDTLYLQFFQGTLDTFCVECQKESVFASLVEMPWWAPRSGPPLHRFKNLETLVGNGEAVFLHEDGTKQLRVTSQYSAMPRIFILTCGCTRDPSHRLAFVFRVADGSVSKVGQVPSLKDLQEHRLTKYRGLLPHEDYRELSTALGLESHGVGIGSFVYLRRIFERLLERAHQDALKTPGWDEAAYAGRMEDKILALKTMLPPFLVKNRKVYAILSKGLHELTEDECKEYFLAIFGAISLMLDQWLEQKQRGQIERELGAAIDKIHNELSDDSK
jgi:hypothetical protein